MELAKGIIITVDKALKLGISSHFCLNKFDIFVSSFRQQVELWWNVRGVNRVGLCVFFFPLGY